MDTLTFWSGILIVLIPQIITMIRDIRAANASKGMTKAQENLTEAQAQEAMGEAMEKLGQEYSRLLGVNRDLQEEVNRLRPLLLKVALTEQAIVQTKKDKADWKHHAEKLTEQLEANRIVPLPFRRITNGDSDKVKAIAREVVKAYTTPEEKILDAVEKGYTPE